MRKILLNEKQFRDFLRYQINEMALMGKKGPRNNKVDVMKNIIMSNRDYNNMPLEGFVYIYDTIGLGGECDAETKKNVIMSFLGENGFDTYNDGTFGIFSSNAVASKLLSACESDNAEKVISALLSSSKSPKVKAFFSCEDAFVFVKSAILNNSNKIPDNIFTVAKTWINNFGNGMMGKQSRTEFEGVKTKTEVKRPSRTTNHELKTSKMLGYPDGINAMDVDAYNFYTFKMEGNYPININHFDPEIPEGLIRLNDALMPYFKEEPKYNAYEDIKVICRRWSENTERCMYAAVFNGEVITIKTNSNFNVGKISTDGSGGDIGAITQTRRDNKIYHYNEVLRLIRLNSEGLFNDEKSALDKISQTTSIDQLGNNDWTIENDDEVGEIKVHNTELSKIINSAIRKLRKKNSKQIHIGEDVLLEYLKKYNVGNTKIVDEGTKRERIEITIDY